MDNNLLKKQISRVKNHAFIIRIWHENVDIPGGENTWRGFIVHVGDEKKLYFDDLEVVGRFIQEQTGIGRAPAFSWWSSLLARLRRSHS